MKLVILAMCLVMTACASSKSRFPNFGAQIKGKTNINVIVDSVFISDIAGTDLGYNTEKNIAARKKIEDAVLETLKEKGFAPNITQTLNGLFYEKNPEKSYYYSEGWKSTGVEYLGASEIASDSAWLSEDVRLFLNAMFVEARELNFSKDSESKQLNETQDQFEQNDQEKIGPDFSEWEKLPDAFASLPKETLLYVRVDGKLQALGKYLAKGLISGALSSALTGGTLWLIPPGSIVKVDVVALDVKNKSILWHAHHASEGAKSYPRTIKTVLRDYPLITGEYPSDIEKARKNERQKIVRPRIRKKSVVSEFD